MQIEEIQHKPRCCMKDCTEIISTKNPVAVTKDCQHPICLNSLLKLKALQEDQRFVSIHCDLCTEMIEYDVDAITLLFKYFGVCFDDTLP